MTKTAHTKGTQYPYTPQDSKGTHQGIEWFTHTNSLTGSVNGYVRVPEALRNTDRFKDVENSGDFVVHGGITYGMDSMGWIGFDTSHYTDWTSIFPYGHRWTVEEVSDECRDLAEQVAAIQQESGSNAGC